MMAWMHSINNTDSDIQWAHMIKQHTYSLHNQWKWLVYMEVTGRHANEVSLKKTNMNEHHFYPRQRHHEQHYADHDQHHHNTWARCSTHTWWWNTHHGLLMETSGVTTRWKHAMCIVHSNHSMVLNEEHTLWGVIAKWHGWESHESLVTRLTTMHGVLHTTSLSMLNQHWCKYGKRITVDNVHLEWWR